MTLFSLPTRFSAASSIQAIGCGRVFAAVWHGVGRRRRCSLRCAHGLSQLCHVLVHSHLAGAAFVLHTVTHRTCHTAIHLLRLQIG